VHGALSKLLALPSLESYNPEMARLEFSLFETAIAANAVDSWRGMTANTPRRRLNIC
jgi:hypothetical protein